jgi:NTP pyrophosphatase (non-canonical NTP hydrolase)
MTTMLQQRMFHNSVDAGWDPERVNTFAEEIAHLHEEVSEAFREWRLHKDFRIRHDPTTGKPLGIPIELADVLIGMFYLAEINGFDLLTAMEEKAAWNASRDYTAEGRQLHAPASSRVDGES